MTGVLAWLTLAGVLAAWPAGRYVRSRWLWHRDQTRQRAQWEAETDAAYADQLDRARFDARLSSAFAAARSATKAEAGRDLRPWAMQIGDRP